MVGTDPAEKPAVARNASIIGAPSVNTNRFVRWRAVTAR
jgi:hypothetical protein